MRKELGREATLRDDRQGVLQAEGAEDRGGYRAGSTCYQLGSLRLDLLWLVKIPS
jgi:hypothetical protein